MKTRLEKLAMVTTVVDRMVAIAEAKQALGIPTIYTNEYRCDECGEDWTSTWDCACDDECAGCGKSYSPYEYKTDLDD